MFAKPRLRYALVSEGKVAEVGVSNFLPEQWRSLDNVLENKLRCNQVELSLTHTAALFNGDIEALQRDRLQLLAWSPLAGGRLEQGGLGERLAEMAALYGCSPTALAIAWLRRIPGAPLPVLGSFNAQRIADAQQGSVMGMNRSDWYALLEATRGHEVA